MNPSIAHAEELLTTFNWDVKHCRQVRNLAMMLFDQLPVLHRLTGDERDLLNAAALLHDIGWTVSHKRHHKHSADLIRENVGQLTGFDSTGIEMIAQIARYHRRAEPSMDHEAFAKLPASQRDIVRQLSAFLRVADGLDRPHRQAVRGLLCATTDQRVRIGLRVAADPAAHIAGGMRKSGLLATAYGRVVDIVVVS